MECAAQSVAGRPAVGCGDLKYMCRDLPWSKADGGPRHAAGALPSFADTGVGHRASTACRPFLLRTLRERRGSSTGEAGRSVLPPSDIHAFRLATRTWIPGDGTFHCLLVAGASCSPCLLSLGHDKKRLPAEEISRDYHICDRSRRTDAQVFVKQDLSDSTPVASRGVGCPNSRRRWRRRPVNDYHSIFPHFWGGVVKTIFSDSQRGQPRALRASSFGGKPE